MRSIEDKGVLNYGQRQEVGGNSSKNFEFHKGNGTNRMASGKPTPSKWDDAQKWLVNLSRGSERHQFSKTTPRNSNADDLRLIAPVPKKEDYSSDEEGEENVHSGTNNHRMIQFQVETKNIDSCDESMWRINKGNSSNASIVQSICVRDMGTEMTPIASQEPSRTATPVRSTTPVRARSPISSGSSSPARANNGVVENDQIGAMNSVEYRVNGGNTNRRFSRDAEESVDTETAAKKESDNAKKLNPLETRAVAWDEAERAKYTARYKREEVKIQAWENHEKRKAEMEMKRIEAKAERIKARSQEKYTSKLASTRRIAEEKRAKAEAQLNEKAVKTSEKADYIRRTGHLPSSFSFKLPSFCW